MAVYRVTYSSMGASYGPVFVDADSPEEAKRKAGNFTAGERASCMKAIEMTAAEVRRLVAEKAVE